MYGNSVLSIIDTPDARELDRLLSSAGESLIYSYSSARSWVLSSTVGLTAEH